MGNWGYNPHLSETNLGGGNSNISCFHPDPWGSDLISLLFFFKWVETTN